LGFWLLLAGWLIFPVTSYGQDWQFRISLAEESYKDGNYPEAISRYKSIADSGFVSGELLYNIGNACYKNRDIPSAILYYERASRYLPHDEDIRFNLELARSNTQDKIDTLNPFFLKVWIFWVRDLMSESAWGRLNIVFLFLTLGALLTFLLSGWPEVRKWSISVFFLSFFIFLLSLWMGILQKNNLQRTDEAIVFSPSVTVKSSPDDSGTNLFVLHEGTKVLILDQIGDWREIRLSDGNKGWIRITELEII